MLKAILSLLPRAVIIIELVYLHTEPDRNSTNERKNNILKQGDVV